MRSHDALDTSDNKALTALGPGGPAGPGSPGGPGSPLDPGSPSLPGIPSLPGAPYNNNCEQYYYDDQATYITSRITRLSFLHNKV